jgi:BON domain-containing protein
MAELLFGTAPQVWPSFPANRPAMIFQGATSDAPPTPLNPGMAPFEFATGITPQALLSTVALRRGQPTGPANDQDVEDFIYDALDLLPGGNDIEVRCDSGRVTLTGSVPHKRVKRDAGEIAWAIPSVNDVQNNITIATRRRSRSQVRDAETGSPSASGRKPA